MDGVYVPLVQLSLVMWGTFLYCEELEMYKFDDGILMSTSADEFVVYNGKKYVTGDEWNDVPNCKLAKADADLLPDDMSTPVAQWLSGRYPYCHVIAMQKHGTEWRWDDGSLVTNVKWKQENWFARQMTLFKNWAMVCVEDSGFIWEKITPFRATQDRGLYECDQDEPSEDELPNTKRKSLVRRRSREAKKYLAGYKVFFEKSKGDITGQPLAQGRYAMVTMCSRACQTRKDCNFFNYNSVTKHCRLFASIEDHLVKVDEQWAIWGAKIQK